MVENAHCLLSHFFVGFCFSTEKEQREGNFLTEWDTRHGEAWCGN